MNKSRTLDRTKHNLALVSRQNKEYYNKHKKELAEKAKTHYQENKTKIKKAQRVYYLKNKETISAKAKLSYQKRKLNIHHQKGGVSTFPSSDDLTHCQIKFSSSLDGGDSKSQEDYE